MSANQESGYSMSGHAGIYAEDAAGLGAHHLLNHDFGLVLLAALICLAGSWVTLKLFQRAAGAAGLQRLGWHVLTSVAAGAATWCTHFIAMLGFDPGVPFSFDPTLTIASLIVAIVGTITGFLIATSHLTRFAPALGGGVVGLAIAAMHYTGMMGYDVRGIVTWDMPVLILSIVFSVLLAAAALWIAACHLSWRGRWTAVGLLVAAIVLLHFTAMVAFRVEPLAVTSMIGGQAAIQALALSIACVGFLIIGAGISSYLIDESVRADSYEQLHYMAITDSLTGLPNRVSFHGRLDHEFDAARARGGKVALACIDLNKFKEINDVRGHAAGDEVLRTLSARMGGGLREGEFVARLGGDEFAAVKRLDNSGELTEFLNRLEAALSEPVMFNGFELQAGGSIGVAIFPDDATDQTALLGNADLAMYRSKSSLTKSTAFYDSSMDELVRARMVLANDLRAALDTDELDVHFQVQKSAITGEVRGYEALLRWRHPVRGSIPPAEFIPIAEEHGLILRVGEWVLRTACARAATWEPAYKIAVNVSPLQFAHADLPKIVLEILIETGLPAHRLELELTESAIFSDTERSLHMLRQIKAMGVTIALDDFGTGYSSLQTLRSFPFDKIKLDRSFVEQVERSEQTAAMVRAVLALGRSLKIPVLAEGVENSQQLSMLTSEGCDEVQGFLLGRPMPESQMVDAGEISLKAAVELAPGADNRRPVDTAGEQAAALVKAVS